MAQIPCSTSLWSVAFSWLQNFFFTLAHPSLKFKPHDCITTSLPLSLSFAIWYIPSFGEDWHLKHNHDFQSTSCDQSKMSIYLVLPVPALSVPYLFFKNVNELYFHSVAATHSKSDALDLATTQNGVSENLNPDILLSDLLSFQVPLLSQHWPLIFQWLHLWCLRCLLTSCPCVHSLGLLYDRPNSSLTSSQIPCVPIFFMLHLEQYRHLPLFFLNLGNRTRLEKITQLYQLVPPQPGSCTTRQFIHS